MRPILGRGASELKAKIVSQPTAMSANTANTANFGNCSNYGSAVVVNAKDEFALNGVEVPLMRSEFAKFDEEFIAHKVQRWSLGDECTLNEMVNRKQHFDLRAKEVGSVKKTECGRSVQRGSVKGKKYRLQKKPEGFCVLCKANGETPQVYLFHSLRDKDNKISCPILRGYDCPLCKNGGGDYAHTLRYCPLNIGPNRAQSIILKIKGGRKACGNVKNKF